MKHTHWQKISKFCTAYAITHALERMIRLKYEATYTHINPLAVAIKGLRGQGLDHFFNRSMSVQDVCKGIERRGRLTARVDKYTVEIPKLEFRTIKNPTKEMIQNAAKTLPVIAYVYGGKHTIMILDALDNGLMIIDSASRKQQERFVSYKQLHKIIQIFMLEPTLEKYPNSLK